MCSGFDHALKFLGRRSVRSARVRCEDEWRNFRASSSSKNWVYLIRWSADRFCWGTSAGTTDRLRKASLFNPKLTGKYDRRVDYLMLKILHGDPEVFVFEVNGPPTAPEGELRVAYGRSDCYGGFAGCTREDVSTLITDEFKRTSHYQSLGASVRRDFEEYLKEVYFAKRWIPGRKSKRTFYWGDSLEPKFLAKIDKAHLEKAIEQVLLVRF